MGVRGRHRDRRAAQLELGRADGAAGRGGHRRPALRDPLVQARDAWTGVSLDTLLADVETTADYVLAHAYGGYTTNLPLADLLDGQAWVAYKYDGDDLEPAHGGPARLLVPHLYLWKSAKWVRGLTLSHDDEPGFWETAGYHNYGDPWREQRYWDE